MFDAVSVWLATIFFVGAIAGIAWFFTSKRKEPVVETHPRPPRPSPSAIVEKPSDDPSNLHVIAVFFNFQRYKKPVENFYLFKKHMEELGVTLHVVELVLGRATFQVTEKGNKNHTQLRTKTEFFQKENMINIGVANAKKNYPDMHSFAWIDTDVRFFNPNLVQETLYKLNRYPVVQMWSRAIDLDPDGHPLEFNMPGNGTGIPHKSGVVYSMAYCYDNGIERDPKELGCRWHPGYAWAMTYECWDQLGGLYDRTPLGSGDHHMSMAFIGRPSEGIHGGVSQEYKDDFFKWSGRVKKVVGGRLGCVKGLLHHSWHGKKSNRKYVERWGILINNGFDPALDLVSDNKGQLFLSDRNPEMAKQMSKYFEGRDDDANRV